MTTQTNISGQHADTPPPFPLAQTGDYRAHLENMRALLQKKNSYEFYHEAERFWDKIRANKVIRKSQKKQQDTPEDAIAIEWCHYLVATAPFISEQDILAGMHWKTERKGATSQSVDISQKWMTFDLFSRGINSHLPIRSRNDESTFQKARLEYMACMLKTMSVELNSLEAILKKYTQEEDAIRQEELRKIITKTYSGAYSILRGPSERLMRVHSRTDSIRHLMRNLERTFASGLRHRFPPDSVSVHRYISSAGYNTKESFRDFLSRTIGRNKNVQHFYNGLPPFPNEGKR